jgi:hypothetical protein
MICVDEDPFRGLGPNKLKYFSLLLQKSTPRNSLHLQKVEGMDFDEALL